MDAPAPPPPPTRRAPGADRMRRSYVRVVVFWALTLLALYAFQEYFA